MAKTIEERAEVLVERWRRGFDPCPHTPQTRVLECEDCLIEMVAAALREAEERGRRGELERIRSESIVAHCVIVEGGAPPRHDCHCVVCNAVRKERAACIVELEAEVARLREERDSWMRAHDRLLDQWAENAPACAYKAERDALRKRLDRARAVLVADGYFTPDQVGDDIAPRILERLAAARRRSL